MKKVSVTLRKMGIMSSGLTLNMVQIDTICGSVNTSLTVNKEDLDHLQDLNLADPPEQWKDGQEVDILLGMDFYQDVMTGRLLHSESGTIAMESIF